MTESSERENERRGLKSEKVCLFSTYGRLGIEFARGNQPAGGTCLIAPMGQTLLSPLEMIDPVPASVLKLRRKTTGAQICWMECWRETTEQLFISYLLVANRSPLPDFLFTSSFTTLACQAVELAQAGLVRFGVCGTR
jgi:hypothetical protein